MGFQGIQSLRLGFSSSGTSSLWAFIIYPTLITLKAMGLSPESRLAELSQDLQNCVLTMIPKVVFVFLKSDF